MPGVLYVANASSTTPTRPPCRNTHIVYPSVHAMAVRQTSLHACQQSPLPRSGRPSSTFARAAERHARCVREANASAYMARAAAAA